MILVFGQSGQLGAALARQSGVTSLSRAEADLENPQACAQAIHDRAPTAVINAAAYTDVDGAEADEARATRINADAPAAMAQACAALDIPFVTVSTDYVFDGSGDDPRQPDDTAAPLNAYGRSKRAGEVAVAQAGGRWAVLRTSWVVSAEGRNFVTTMLRLGAERDALRIVADQIGAPTPAEDLAQACLIVAQALAQDPDKRGIYHFAGAPDTSWADFATAIFDAAGLGCTVQPIPTSEYLTPAPRPLNSRLDCRATTHVFGLPRPDWRDGLGRILQKRDAT